VGLFSSFRRRLQANIERVVQDVRVVAPVIAGVLGGPVAAGLVGALTAPSGSPVAAGIIQQAEQQRKFSRQANDPFGTAAGAPPVVGTGDPFFTRGAVVTSPSLVGRFGRVAPAAFLPAQQFAPPGCPPAALPFEAAFQPVQGFPAPRPRQFQRQFQPQFQQLQARVLRAQPVAQQFAQQFVQQPAFDAFGGFGFGFGF